MFPIQGEDASVDRASSGTGPRSSLRSSRRSRSRPRRGPPSTAPMGFRPNRPRATSTTLRRPSRRQYSPCPSTPRSRRTCRARSHQVQERRDERLGPPRDEADGQGLGRAHSVQRSRCRQDAVLHPGPRFGGRRRGQLRGPEASLRGPDPAGRYRQRSAAPSRARGPANLRREHAGAGARRARRGAGRTPRGARRNTSRRRRRPSVPAGRCPMRAGGSEPPGRSTFWHCRAAAKYLRPHVERGPGQRLGVLLHQRQRIGLSFTGRPRAQNSALVPGQAGTVSGGLHPGDVPILVAVDYALTPAILVGGRIGGACSTRTPGAAGRDGSPCLRIEAPLGGAGDLRVRRRAARRTRASRPRCSPPSGMAEFDGHTASIVSMSQKASKRPRSASR